METAYILIGGLGVIAFVFVMNSKRSSGYRAILAKLENENNLMELRANALDEERQQAQANVAELRGRQEAKAEAEAARRQAESDAALQLEKARAESFMDFLLRTGTVTAEHLAKVQTYKTKNRNTNSEEELLIMLDFMTVASMKQAKVQYDAARSGTPPASQVPKP